MTNFNVNRQVNSEKYVSLYFKNKNEERMKTNIEITKGKKILFCGLCRNIEERVAKNIRMLEELGSYFGEYKIILFENDSKDDTRTIIKNLSDINKNIKLIQCENNENCIFNDPILNSYGSLSNKRIDRMAYFRNQYMKLIKEKYSNYDYVMMIDMDIEGYMNIDGFLENFSLDNEEKWDAIFASGIMEAPYTLGSIWFNSYDALAYVGKKDNIDKYQNELSKSKLIYNFFNQLREIKNSDGKYVPIQSAFNGCGIYKLKSMIDYEYECGWSCEHISLHNQMIKNGNDKLFINKNWEIYVGIQGPTQNYKH